MFTYTATTAQIILISPNLHSHLYLNITLIWRTSGRNVWSSQTKQCSVGYQGATARTVHAHYL